MVYSSAVLPFEQTLFEPFSRYERPALATSISLPGLDEDDEFEPSDDPPDDERDPFEPPEAEEEDDAPEEETDSDADSEDEEADDDAAELDFGD